MNEDLRKKLLEDIDTSGFGSEMRAVSAFQEGGWNVTGAAAYYDRDSNITREIDIIAHHGIQSDSPASVELFYAIAGEVKKAKNPWIVIRGGTEYGWERLDAWDNLVFVDGLKGSKRDLVKAFSQSSLSRTVGWIGRGLHESFKSPDASSRWYTAFVSACKAAEDHLARNTPVHDEGVTHFYLSKPLVILDGQLFSAKLASGDIVIEEIDYATYRFSFQTQEYKQRHYLVDLVRLSALPAYLDLTKRRTQAIFNALVRDSSSHSRKSAKPVKKLKKAEK